MTKTFRLEAVVTISAGRMVCTMDEVYQILDHMTGENLFTHQLVRAWKPCAEWLKIRNPDLAHADHRIFGLIQSLEVTQDKEEIKELCERWVESLKDDGMPSTYEVEPLPPGVYEAQDPIGELREMVSDDTKIVVVSTDH